MTEQKSDDYSDPITAPFWDGARRHQLLIQICRSCGHHQFFPRPVCLTCFAVDMDWVSASGLATVYSQTTVRIPVVPELEPPYRVAVVELDEGPRLTTNLVGPEVPIGARVRVIWRERSGDAPPVPVFESIGTEQS